MKYTESAIRERAEKFCENSIPFVISGESDIMRDLILDLLRENSCTEKGILFSAIARIIIAGKVDKSDMAMVMSDVGFAAFENGEAEVAEAAFRVVIEMSNNNTNRNNLAYVIRRRGNLNGERIREVIDLLSDGVRFCSSYSLVNMALLFGLELGTDSDWKLADTLISKIMEPSGVVTWWQEQGLKNDAEGYLVHLWLLRHRIVADSALGPRELLWEKVSAAYSKAPAWLATEPVQTCAADPE